jgi:mRNA-degrading endonuclease YafQ of YafQ-DinJ toxin-antitoxin module
MSRSLGLREDQRQADVLMRLIIASLPAQPRWRDHRQVGGYRSCAPVRSATEPDRAAQR